MWYVSVDDDRLHVEMPIVGFSVLGRWRKISSFNLSHSPSFLLSKNSISVLLAQYLQSIPGIWNELTGSSINDVTALGGGRSRML